MDLATLNRNFVMVLQDCGQKTVGGVDPTHLYEESEGVQLVRFHVKARLGWMHFLATCAIFDVRLHLTPR